MGVIRVVELRLKVKNAHCHAALNASSTRCIIFGVKFDPPRGTRKGIVKHGLEQGGHGGEPTRSATAATTTTSTTTTRGDGGEGQTEEGLKGLMRARRVTGMPTRVEVHGSPQEWQEEVA